MWPLLKELDDPELAKLVEKLPATLLHSRAESSVRKYTGAYRRWKSWATTHQLPHFPAQPHHIVLYLQSIGDQLESVSAAEAAVNALSWVHGLNLVQASSKKKANVCEDLGRYGQEFSCQPYPGQYENNNVQPSGFCRILEI